jgi:hypothetical protein
MLLRARLAEFVSIGEHHDQADVSVEMARVCTGKNGVGKFGHLSPKPLPYLLSCFLLLQRVNIYCPLFY